MTTIPIAFERDEREEKRAEVLEILGHGRAPHWSWQKPFDLESLIDFCLTGEMRVEKENGHCLIHVFPAVVTVRHITGRAVSELYEAFMIQHGKRRKRYFDGTLAEKIRFRLGEQPLEAARRGIREELGQTEPLLQTIGLDLEECNVLNEPRDESDYYPGVPAVYHRHRFRYILPFHLRHEEYVANDQERQLHFLWKDMMLH